MSAKNNTLSTIQLYAQLMRFDKPVGTLLLLWPTLWALWLAADGMPDTRILFIFILGVVIMRAAGCVINDIADHRLDSHVARTRDRPLATKQLSLKNAWWVFFILLSLALCLVLLLNPLCLLLACFAVITAIIYPFLKRITHLPQLGLGIAFSFGIPMAFAAIQNKIPFIALVLFMTNCLWIILYDTLYAMADRLDDPSAGIRSTALLLGKYDKFVIGCLQIAVIFLLYFIGSYLQQRIIFNTMLFFSSVLFVYQQWLIRDRLPANCLRAFKNNQWIGLLIFIGILYK